MPDHACMIVTRIGFNQSGQDQITYDSVHATPKDQANGAKPAEPPREHAGWPAGASKRSWEERADQFHDTNERKRPFLAIKTFQQVGAQRGQQPGPSDRPIEGETCMDATENRCHDQRERHSPTPLSGFPIRHMPTFDDSRCAIACGLRVLTATVRTLKP